MTAQMVAFFQSFFANPNPIGVGLAIAFGIVWLVPYLPPLFKRPVLWVVMAVSAFLTLAAISFIQIPLQSLAGQGIVHFWTPQVIASRLLLFGIPQILISGLVQEGAKMLPVVWFWRRENGRLDRRLGLEAGAVAGAGFGVFEAQWAHDSILASGMLGQAFQTQGLLAFTGFGERFVVVAAHIAFSALVGYGLASGRGGQCYLIASGLHALLNYSVVLTQAGALTGVQSEVYIAVIALGVSTWALWLRWQRLRPQVKIIPG